MKKIEVVDLFCGAGGLTHGLLKAGLRVSKGIDIDPNCRFPYEKNNKKAQFIQKSITDLSNKEINSLFEKDTKVRILVGCAPCQTFSKHTVKYKYDSNDSRWCLLNNFLKIIKKTKPHLVSMENVPNLRNKKIFTEFYESLISLGYKVSFGNVYCPDYGVPQKRRRLVLLASLFGEIDIINPTAKKYKTVLDSISKLEKIKNGQQSKKDSLHKAASLSPLNLQRIKQSKEGGTWNDWDKKLKLKCHKKKTGSTYTSVYGRMKWNEPAPTLTTQFYIYGTGRFGHPKQNRAISLREAALLQSFPKSYKFSAKNELISFSKVGTLIGNAVPPKLGEAIGKSIKKHLKDVGYE